MKKNSMTKVKKVNDFVKSVPKHCRAAYKATINRLLGDKTNRTITVKGYSMTRGVAREVSSKL